MSEPIEAFAGNALATNGPHGIREVLFDQWDFCLDWEFDVLQIRVGPSIGCNAGQNPGTTLLVHKAASAIDWINDNAPDRFGLRELAWQHHLTTLQSLSYEDERRSRSDLPFKHFHQ